ncbi:hypothetical protein Acsp01_64330 [Actinoplanes sp. NBRC 101535]|nr:hypothetical protein Acsp01_64330 [Actinoplanes sp. NBRC 101535]
MLAMLYASSIRVPSPSAEARTRIRRKPAARDARVASAILCPARLTEGEAAGAGTRTSTAGSGAGGPEGGDAAAEDPLLTVQ